MTELEKQLLEALKSTLQWIGDAYETAPDVDFEPVEQQAVAAIAAAEAAQTMRHHKPVATVRVTHKGYIMKLSTYVAYALPEGMHDVYAVQQPASAKPVAVPDEMQYSVVSKGERIPDSYVDGWNACRNAMLETMKGASDEN